MAASIASAVEPDGAPLYSIDGRAGVGPARSRAAATMPDLSLGRLRRAFSSARWQRAFTAVAVLAVVLLAAGTAQYTALRDSLIDTRTAGLREELSTARADFERIPRLRSQAARGQLCGPGSNDLSVSNAARQLATAVTGVGGRDVLAVIYDRRLLPVSGSDTPPPGTAAPAFPRLSPAALRRALAGVESAPETVDGGDGPQLVVGFPIQFEDGAPCAVAQLSSPMRPIDNVLKAERTLLIRAGSILLGLAFPWLLLGFRGRTAIESRTGSGT
ncbi:MAG: hypothetical protein ABR564_06030 [Candidatus Dormibacteria bacterium]